MQTFVYITSVLFCVAVEVFQDEDSLFVAPFSLNYSADSSSDSADYLYAASR